jgi:hypothetical protein
LKGFKLRRIRKKRNTLKSIYNILLVAIIFGAIYLYNSSFLERNEPNIEIANQISWNMKDKIDFSMSDDSGIKHYKIILTDGKNDLVLDSKVLQNPQSALSIEINPPKTGVFFERNSAELIIEATDTSKWNLLSGNSSTKRVKVNIDTKKPHIKVVDSSYGIRKGGSALVVFKATDDHLESVHIDTNFGKKFKPVKFYKDGYYISMLAWPLWEETFKATIVAKDKAGNVKSYNIPLHLKGKNYKISRIKLKDNFLNGKITQLYDELEPKVMTEDLIQKFKYINENERKSNEEIIHSITSKVEEEYVDNYSINPLYPLKNAAVVARFGDHRLFYRRSKNSTLSESYHLGLDLASTSMADITTTNDSKVVFNSFNGIYGNMVVLYHGLGIYTLYGHCTTSNTTVGEMVKAGSVIAQSGKTGLALGDHLHFGVLVQGIEVRPEEFMDKRWLKLNIFDTITNAKRYIDS